MVSLKKSRLARSARLGKAARAAKGWRVERRQEGGVDAKIGGIWALLEGIWPVSLGDQDAKMQAFGVMAEPALDALRSSGGQSLARWAAGCCFAPALREMAKAGVDVMGHGVGAQLESVACQAASMELSPGRFSNLRWEDSLELLLELGWNPSDIAHPAWRLALSHAAYYGRAGFVELLLSRGVEPSAPSSQMPHPLEFAALGADDSGEIARMLLSAGADVDLAGSRGLTAMELAGEMGRQRMVEAMSPWDLSRREQWALSQCVKASAGRIRVSARI
jgi:hypothetical protein